MAFTERTLTGINKLIADLKQMVANSVTPARTVSWFYRDTAPNGWAICDGRTVTMNDGTTLVTPNLIGRYPLGATSNIGSTVDAGLPNITGTFKVGNRTDVTPAGTGAFGIDKTFLPCANSAGSKRGAYYSFNAAWSNSIYGRSTTVTPPSVKLLPCIKL